MGNQLTGIAPSQIQSVEQYLLDVPDYTFETSLGSTRFFKVARARNKEGLSVVKVFVIHDPSLPLLTHKTKLDEISQRLKGTSNCLPFQKSLYFDRAALLFRQYVKDSLYDRISTRPFLNAVEKKWIAFQLLCALNQCHKVKVCHGDIKSENVMITGWNWVLLTDFASFKPTYLPEDNPSDFSYFFDTSRRRTCYIAPERFVEGGWRNSDAGNQMANIDLTSSEIMTGDLTPAMDIFSAGCVITELFTEGTAPFDLSQLLGYRSGEYSPWKVLEKIEDTSIRELVRHMMQKDPNHRLSAEEYLIKQRGKAFPEFFYTFLKLYLQQFVLTPIKPPDDRIAHIKHELVQILKHLKIDDNNVDENASLVLIISIVGSSSRNIHFCNARLDTLDLLLELSLHVSTDIILDRIVPYMLHFAHDPFPHVRAGMLQTITQCLSKVKSVPRSDSNVFPEYIFPSLTHLVQDPVALVRAAYAQNIAQLAETALRVLEMTQLQEMTEMSSQDDTREASQYELESSYDMELQSLQETIQQKVVTLLSDLDNTVKQTLLENGITRLCVFFGRQKANDVLLSHMITFLNDKYDWHIRASFFDNIVGVAAYVGWQSSSILKPLIEQGLSDSNEFVVHKAIGALASLAELGLMQKPMLQEFVQEVVPFLAHPGVWIRQSAVGFVAVVAKTLNIADIHCKLLPQVNPFLKHQVLQLDNESIVLNALDEPIPRSVFDYVLRSLVDGLFETLQNRQYIRSISRAGHKPIYPELAEHLIPIFRKLTYIGMTESHEDKLLRMKDFIIKLHRSRAGSAENSVNEDSPQAGTLNLQNYVTVGKVVTRRHADLYRSKDHMNEGQQSPTSRRKKKVQHPDTPAVTMNAEWKKMFGSVDVDKSLTASQRSKMTAEKPDSSLDKKSLMLSGHSSASSIVNVSRDSTTTGDGSVKKVPSHQTRYAVCKWELRNIVHKRREQYKVDILTKDLLEGIAWDSRPPPDNWKPRGLLVAHLQEHRSAVNRIQVCDDHRYFATCSNDGTVKLWECSKLEGKSVANRSKHTLNKQGGRIKCLTFCESSQSVASASDNATIHVYRIDADRLSPVEIMDVDKQKYGHVVDITHFDAGSQSVLTYATVNGYLMGWDLRSNSMAWQLKNDARTGLITSFAVHHTQCWLAIGTSSGCQVCWDMRFQLPINTITHPTGARVRRLIMHPKDLPWIVSALQWNNEVSMWDVETGARQKSLWASTEPPLSQSQTNGHAVHGMHIAATDTKIFLLTGGSDMRCRFWDLTNPANSFIMSNAATDPTNISFSYRSQLIDGTEVIQEVCTKKQISTEDIPRRVPEAPSSGHHDIISDVSICQASQCLVITASRDGVVKVWK
ncbi:phosphoinositide 3-kinase regulatory subunit 4-like [Gigantopelta aegis]|uniref:phosphoinositide 3-kinase regulatory subunit 4-like n=1 Tax=Gigantopelta aegis TaxID=1735272 RepID=UPI001B889B5A|nr:phosphoinositide 3-kinase regulatory subunit 4-like [Gigantopelta aegis]XP_041377702.1 phosphoinositide 3-kinase regulatory subunit 4-like [Gigantopelta aegis]